MSAGRRVSTRETRALSEPLWHQSSTELTEQQRRLRAGSTDAHVPDPLTGPEMGDVAGGNGGVGGSDSHRSPCQNLSSPNTSSPLVTPVASIPSQGNSTAGVGRPVSPSSISEGGDSLSLGSEGVLQDQQFADDVEDDVLLIDPPGSLVDQADDNNSTSSGMSAILGSSDSEPEQFVFNLNQPDQPVVLTEQTGQTDSTELSASDTSSEEHFLNSSDSEPEQTEFLLGDAQPNPDPQDQLAQPQDPQAVVGALPAPNPEPILPLVYDSSDEEDMPTLNVFYDADAGYDEFCRKAAQAYAQNICQKTDVAVQRLHEIALRQSLIQGLPDDAQEDLEGWAAGNVPATDARHGGHAEAPWSAPDIAGMATFAHILDAIKQFCKPASEETTAESKLQTLTQRTALSNHYTKFVKLARSCGYTLNEAAVIKMFKNSLASGIKPKLKKEGLSSLKV